MVILDQTLTYFGIKLLFMEEANTTVTLITQGLQIQTSATKAALSLVIQLFQLDITFLQHC